MRRAAFAAGALALALGAGLFGLGRVLGVGPLAPGAPQSWLYVAVIRNDDDEGSRDVEIVDVQTGERRRFEFEARATEIALSRDRRTLYVGSTNGRVLEVDSIRGAVLGEIVVSAPGEVRRLLPLPDGRRLLVVTGTSRDAALALVDLTTGNETQRLLLREVIAGKPLLRGGVVLLPAAAGSADQLIEVELDSLGVRRTTHIVSAPSAFRSPPVAALAPDGAVVVSSPTTGTVALLAAEESGARRDTSVDRPSPLGRAGSAQGDLMVTADGTVHVCLGVMDSASRYTLSMDELKPVRVGSECGRFVGLADGTLYLGIRGRPELAVLDAATGAVRRTMPLTGLAWRLTN
jgi:hypothetical protein